MRMLQQKRDTGHCFVQVLYPLWRVWCLRPWLVSGNRKKSQSVIFCIHSLKSCSSFRIINLVLFSLWKGHAAISSMGNMHINCIRKTSFPSAILCNISTSPFVMRTFHIIWCKMRKRKEYKGRNRYIFFLIYNIHEHVGFLKKFF